MCFIADIEDDLFLLVIVNYLLLNLIGLFLVNSLIIYYNFFYIFIQFAIIIIQMLFILYEASYYNQ